MPTNGGLIGTENLPLQQGRTKVTSFTSSGNFTISPNYTLGTADCTVVAGGGRWHNCWWWRRWAGGIRNRYCTVPATAVFQLQ